MSYTGVNSNLRASKILDEQQLNELEVLTSEGEFNFIDFDGGPFIAKDSIIEYENNQLIVKKIVFLDNRYHIVTDVVENNKGE